MNQKVTLVFSGIMLLAAASPRAAAISEEALARGLPSLAPMLQSVTPAVVNIRVARTVPTASHFFFNGESLPDQARRYLERVPGPDRQGSPPPLAGGAGSGVIVNAEQGYIVTNHHVVDSASTISVQLHDGRVLQAQLLGSDANTDVALLQVEADDLAQIAFAEIDSVMVGDYVVAIGNPFGIGQTVTSGIVSALGRTGLNNENYEDFIQTDAAINVGNSGGALVDLEGHLIGINSAIISGNGGSNGVGFAVPVDMVAAVMEHLVRDGEVRRGLLGINITDLTPEVAAALGAETQRGAVVTNVLPGSAAEKAGIEVSDIIVQLDGRAVDSGRELRNLVGLKRLDQEVELVLLRDGEEVSLAATIGRGDEGAGVDAARPGRGDSYQGARLRSLRRGDSSFSDSGVMVLEVEPQSRAWAAGLRPGDIIVEVNRQAVANLDRFEQLLAGTDRFAAVTILREGRPLLLFLR